jgi:cytochrome c oxidase subunit IV
MSEHAASSEPVVEDTSAPHGTVYQRIGKPFLILLAITVVEFILALAIPESMMPKSIKNILYIVLTIAKAFYIMAFFMHLKYEKIGLIYALLVPVVFVIALIAALFREASFLNY